MAKLKFNIVEVRKLMNNMSDTDKLSIVGDHGVYLMCMSEKSEKRTIVYANGIHPEKNEHTWWEKKASTFGGDDGVDHFGTKAELKRVVDACTNNFIVDITSSSIGCSNDYVKPKKVTINPNNLPDSLRKQLGI